jgi:signal peptidase I
VTKAEEKQPHRPPVRPRHPWRDTIEGILGALVLVLIIRHFVFEVFRIPTGSMAPTLLGQHRDLKCPNCGLEFAVDGTPESKLSSGGAVAICPNCKYEFPTAEVRKTFCTCFPSWPPALFGGGDNRVIVDKFMWDYSEDGLARRFYRGGLPRAFSPPKRWDVIVFHCPVAGLHCRTCGADSLNVRIDEGLKCPVCGSTDVQIIKGSEKNYIKRLIGLPGETIRIRHGDIYVNGKLAVRPPDVQDAQWQFVYDSAYVPKKAVKGVPAAWVAEEGDAKLDGATLRLTPGAGGKAAARYGRTICDASTYSGYDNTLPYRSVSDRDAAYYPVGEIKWDAEVTLNRAGMLRLAIDEDESRYVGTVRFGGAAAKTSLRAANEGVASVESEFEAVPGKPHRVTFSNASGRLELAVDGETVLSCGHPMAENDQAVSSGASLSVESAEAQFSRVRLYRSVYYRPPDGGNYGLDTSKRSVMMPDSLIGPGGYRLPEGQYLALGDNQPTSWDSRYWGTVPRRNLIGQGVVLWWPMNMLRAIY